MKKRDLKLITLEWYRDAERLYLIEKWNVYVKGVAEAYRNVLQNMGYSYKNLKNTKFVNKEIKELRESTK